MNGRIIFSAIIAISLCIGAAAALERSMPAEAGGGGTINVTFTGEHALGERIVIAELLPQGATLRSYVLSGLRESRPPQHDGRTIVWDLTVIAPMQSLVYALELPAEGDAKFDAVYATSGEEHGNLKGSVRIMPAAPAAQPPLLPSPSLPNMEAPAPMPSPQEPSYWIFLLGAIFLSCAGLVYVVETSSRHHVKRPFGHHSARIARHIAAKARTVASTARAVIKGAVAKSLGGRGVAVHNPHAPGAAVSLQHVHSGHIRSS